MGKIIAPFVKASTFGKIDLDPGRDTPKAIPLPAPDPEMEGKAESRRLQRKRRTGRTSTVLSGASSLG